MPEIYWKIPVARWAAYPNAFDSDHVDGPDVGFIPAMLRRRLGGLARIALYVAHACTDGRERIRVVYSSRHGELGRTVALLGNLATGDPVSPTAFSLSVHNAAAGIFSTLRHDTSPATAIAAGHETFGFGLLEAAGQYWATPETPVLLIYVDEPVPQEYAAFGDPWETPHAVAVLLTREAENEITCGIRTDKQAYRPEHVLQSTAFLRCLAGCEDTSWSGHDRTWTWRHAH